MRKKILLVTRPISPPWDEASKNFAYFLAKTMRQSDLHVLTPGTVLSLESHIKQEPLYNDPQLNWHQRIKLLGLFRLARNFDILHFMLTPNRLNSFAFKNILRTSNVKTIQTVATLREDLFSKTAIKKSLFADIIITYSDYAKNKLQEMGLKNIKRIYPGIDLDLYRYAEKDRSVMEKFKISPLNFVITYPGEYTRLGATDHIVDLLPDLFEMIPDAKFIFACRIKNETDLRKKEEVIKKLKEKNILDKIVFTDTFADMPKLYNISDIVVFPVMDMKGKFDVPLAVIEAFACEKPVIVSDIPVLGEFTNNENSVIIEAGNKNMLLSSIEKLQKDSDLRQKLGKAARKYAEKDFDIKDVSERYEDIYNQVLKN